MLWSRFYLHKIPGKKSNIERKMISSQIGWHVSAPRALSESLEVLVNSFPGRAGDKACVQSCRRVKHFRGIPDEEKGASHGHCMYAWCQVRPEQV
jgi:hypothetical protein